MVRLFLANGRRVPRPPIAKAVPAILVALTFCAFPVTGQEESGPLPPRSQRTASWYAQNPTALRFVTEACQDDPGRLRSDRDCINAAQARILVAEREARSAVARRGSNEHRRNRGNTVSPTSPRYWVTRPQERAHQLAQCGRMRLDRMDPSSLAPRICDAARS